MRKACIHAGSQELAEDCTEVHYLIESGNNDSNESLIKHLVGALGANVHMAWQHCDVRVRVVPPNDPHFRLAAF